MTTSVIASGVFNGGLGVSSMATAALNVLVGDAIAVFWHRLNTDTLTSLTDTAGNTYTSDGTVADGTSTTQCFRTIVTTANASNVIALACNFGNYAMSWVQLRTTALPFTVGTIASPGAVGGAGVSPVSTASFNTSAAGAVVAGLWNANFNNNALTNSGSLTILSSQVSDLSTRFTNGLSGATYAGAQTGLTAAVADADSSCLLHVYAIAFNESVAAPPSVAPMFYQRKVFFPV